jgi:hypothetical protein
MFKSPLNSTQLLGETTKNFSFLLFDVSLYSLLNLKQWEKVKVFLSYSIFLSISHSYTECTHSNLFAAFRELYEYRIDTRIKVTVCTVCVPAFAGWLLYFILTHKYDISLLLFIWAYKQNERGIDNISQKGNSNFSLHQILQVLAEFLFPINQSTRWPKNITQTIQLKPNTQRKENRKEEEIGHQIYINLSYKRNETVSWKSNAASDAEI